MSTRIETLTLRELLERPHTILVDPKDEHLTAAAWPKQASLTLDLRETSQSGLNCFRCGGSNHLVRDCMQHSSVKNQKDQPCNKTGHLVKNCLRNRNRGREPQQWVDLIRKTAEPSYCACAISPSKHDFNQIRSPKRPSWHKVNTVLCQAGWSHDF